MIRATSPRALGLDSPRLGVSLGILCLVAALGCKPDPVTPTTDPESTPDPGGPTAAVDSATDAPEPEPEPEPEVQPGGGDDAGDGGEDTGEGEDTDGEDGTVAVAPEPKEEPEPKEKEKPAAEDEKPPLPKPIHALSGPKCQKQFNVGSNVKAFRLPSVTGDKNISPAGYRKRVMLLNFWGTWCKPCLEELPEFDRLYRKYRGHGLTLVAVATDEDPEPVQAFIDKHKLRAKVALEGEEAAGAYKRPNFPFSFVVSQGKIVAAYEFIDDSCMGDLEQVIRDELEKL